MWGLTADEVPPLLRYEMTLDRREFERLLPRAVGEFQRTGKGAEEGAGEGSYAGRCGAGRWRLRIVGERGIGHGLIRLTALSLEISFEDCAEADRRRFLEGFARHFQRGGG